ncbi:hypothetical protein CDD83_2832 [Cordyceps sp. RAO-2017]|nr:hypothetical protein CDD83_2832 [Cordyceps sp. RAO-2017]
MMGTHDVILKDVRVNITARSRLDPTSKQIKLHSLQMLNEEYAVAYFGRPLPPFTTEDFALIPFSIGEPAGLHAGANLTANTTKLFSDLTCRPAEVTENWTKVPYPSKNVTHLYLKSYHVNDSLPERGCSFDLTGWAPNNETSSHWIDYFKFEPTGYPFDLSFFPLAPGQMGVEPQPAPLTGSCLPTSSPMNTTMIAWAEKAPIKASKDLRFLPSYTLKARLCERQYYKQEVSATVSAAGFKVYPDSLRSLSEPVPLTQAEFDVSHFESLMLLGGNDQLRDLKYELTPSELDQFVSSYHGMDSEMSEFVTPFARARGEEMKLPMSIGSKIRLFAHALYPQDDSIEANAEPRTLEQTFRRAQSFLFSYAASSALANQTGFSDQAALLTYRVSGIVISRPLAIAAECLLLLIALTGIALLYLCCNTYCILDSDPSSISYLCGICNASPEMIDLYTKLDACNEKTLESAIGSSLFRLSRCGCPGRCQLRLERAESSIASVHVHVVGATEHPEVDKGSYRPEIPFEITRGAGTLFVIVLLSALAAFVILKWWEVSRAGKFVILL